MNPNQTRAAIPALRWTLGLVVFVESLRTALTFSAMLHVHYTGLPPEIVVILASAEALAAILFLIPWTEAAGSYALIAIFAMAGLLHLLHEQYDIGALLVYGVAVFVTLAFRGRRTAPLV